MERGVAGGLAARCVDEAQARGVGEQADRDLRLAQEALQARLRRGLPATVVVGVERGVEVCGGREFGDEEEPGGAVGLGVGRVAGRALVGPTRVGDRVGRPQRLAIFGEGDFERVG